MLYYIGLCCLPKAMGLPLAVVAHREGRLEEAERQYERALEQGHSEALLFQNLGALLRRRGENARALELYNRGLALNPGDIGILTNRANLQRGSSPATALADALAALRQRQALGHGVEKTCDLWLTVFGVLREQGCPQWALAVARAALAALGADPQLLAQLLLLLDGEGDAFALPAGALEPLQQQIEAQLQAAPPALQAELRFALASHALQKAELPRALGLYELGMAALRQQQPADAEEAAKHQKLIDINSWNFGCTLLKAQQLQRGWQLFEYGLRAPSEGKQRWQRALRKPFSAGALPLWRGEPLAGRRLLLLDEQAIGDAMMFLTLVPALLPEAERLGVMLSDRLVPIYRRHFGERLEVWSYSDAREGRLKPVDYDLQCPLGSICQHRFTDPQCYAPRVPMLVPKQPRSSQLRQHYLAAEGAAAEGPVERLIGISWKGGGVPGRIQQKSVPLEAFATLIAPLAGVRFVSLQYGDVAAVVQQWRGRGLDVLHDPRVNALENMNLWLDQVAACDAVISVANTTIHGAGGLNRPTLCLLSRHSDWRWFDDPAVTRSLWYPSVGIVRETVAEGWTPALAAARQWLEQGTPMPTGPVATTALRA